MAEVLRGKQEMLSNMTPSLQSGEYVFCSTVAESVGSYLFDAVGMFRESEGLTIILDRQCAQKTGFDTSLPMRQITLNVNSALDGVGLTAAVATALADANIPCNMVAAFHHDHVFVPAALADAAMRLLISVQDAASRQ